MNASAATAGVAGHVEFVMGTAVSFTVVEPCWPDAIPAACAWLHWVDETFSTFRATSEICRIQTGALDPAKSHPLVREVLGLCDDLFVRSDGVFDPYARGFLDPAGVVKGWAVEHAAKIMSDAGATNFTINAGGDIVVRGELESGVAWTTGVRNPTNSDEIVKIVTHGRVDAIATSGAYERGNHIVATGSGPPYPGCLSATVRGPSLTFADAYATIVFAMGPDGLGWLVEQPGAYEGYVIVNSQQALATRGFDQRC